MQKNTYFVSIVPYSSIAIFLPHEALQRSKTHYPFLALIPKVKERRLQALANSEGLDGSHFRRFVIAPLQIIIGDSRSNVVNVMIAYVARKPLEQPGQSIVRATLHRNADRVPFFMTGPEHAVELVLKVRNKSIQELPNRLLDVRLFIFSDGLVPNWLGSFAFEGPNIASHIEPAFISVCLICQIIIFAHNKDYMDPHMTPPEACGS